MALIMDESTELAALKSAAGDPVEPNKLNDQTDPYGLEPPPGRRLRRFHQDRLAHLFLSGLRVVQAEKEREREETHRRQ